MGSLNLALLSCRREQTPGIMVVKDTVTYGEIQGLGQEELLGGRKRRQRLAKNAGLAEAGRRDVGTLWGVSE